MQRLADQLIGDVRPIEVAGIDVVDAARHRLAQHRERRVAVLGRTEHTGTGELHRAVAEAVHDTVTQGEGAGNTEINHGETPMLNAQCSTRPHFAATPWGRADARGTPSGARSRTNASNAASRARSELLFASPGAAPIHAGNRRRR
jgi:hypothetical protein